MSNRKTLGMVPKDYKFRWDMNVKRSQYEDFYNQKYFNLFMAKWSIKGDALTTRSKYYLMKQMYTRGSVALWNIKNTDMLGVAPYAASTFDMYDFPISGSLINERNVSTAIIPSGELPINSKDGFVVGYIQPNHRNIAATVQLYAKRLAEIDMIINTNAETHKLPFIIATNDADSARLKDLVQRILNNEVAVFANVSDVNAIKAIATGTNYIIDRLVQFKQATENELKTYLGIDNHGADVKSTYINNSQTNANNSEIQGSGDSFQLCLDDLAKDVKEFLNKEISFMPNQVFSEDTVIPDAGVNQAVRRQEQEETEDE